MHAIFGESFKLGKRNAYFCVNTHTCLLHDVDLYMRVFSLYMVHAMHIFIVVSFSFVVFFFISVCKLNPKEIRSEYNTVHIDVFFKF